MDITKEQIEEMATSVAEKAVASLKDPVRKFVPG